MKRKTYFLPVFLIAISITLCIFLLSQNGLLGFLQNGILTMTFPLGNGLTTFVYKQQKKLDGLGMLKKQNEDLSAQVVALQSLEQDNKALRDQFETQNPPSTKLLPAHIVGMPEVIPNITYPENFIIDLGQNDGLTKGMTVVTKDNLIGNISDLSSRFAKVTLVTNKSTSFSAKDSSTGALGVLKGMGNGEMLFDNVTLSDTIKVNDFIVTLGSQDLSGSGYPPNLIVGRISSVDKSPSSLFQNARIIPLLDLSHLSIVFVLK